MIAIAPRHNSRGKRDADEFQREARKLIKSYDGELILFDNRKPLPARRAEISVKLELCCGSEVIAFFCHGWKTGLQTGHGIADIPELVELLRPLGVATVCLYACLCASGIRNGERSFASQLRRAMGEVHVWAHATRGHTTKNPDVIAFDSTGCGGYYPVPRDSAHWSKWVRALRQGGWLKFADTDPWDVSDVLGLTG